MERPVPGSRVQECRQDARNYRYSLFPTFHSFEAKMKFSLPLVTSAVLIVAGMAAYSFAFDPPKDSEPAATSTKSSKANTLSKSKKMSDEPIYNKLTPQEQRVILHKDTDRPGNGGLTKNKADGIYICKRCNAPLYNSTHKFMSDCGWPSFDDEIENAVERKLETDGSGRIEIICKNCSGHLGHVFEGERLTTKNIRHCVNSSSMTFIAKGKDVPKVIKRESDSEKAGEVGDKPSASTSKANSPIKANDK